MKKFRGIIFVIVSCQSFSDLFSRVLFSFLLPLLAAPLPPLFWTPFRPVSALFCRAKGTAQILERGSFRMHLSTKFGKEIPSRNLREKGQFCLCRLIPGLLMEFLWGVHQGELDQCFRVAWFLCHAEERALVLGGNAGRLLVSLAWLSEDLSIAHTETLIWCIRGAFPPCGGQNRVDLSFFPCFTVFGGPKIPRWWKNHKKCHCHTPSHVPQMLAKTRTWEQCPHMLAGKAREKWQIDPMLIYIPPLWSPTKALPIPNKVSLNAALWCSENPSIGWTRSRIA